MTFNSLGFIFLFIPAVVLGYTLAGRISPSAAKVWLILASLVFYAWGEPLALSVLAGSILFNYWISSRLDEETAAGKNWLRLALAINIGALCVFKYGGFATGGANAVFRTNWSFPALLLPLGISFFTVQQIMFLVDRYQGVVPRPNLLDYTLFVSWFPYITAGPITRWKDVIPQFEKRNTAIDAGNIARGATLFVLGLAKKVILASAFAPWADEGFLHPGGLGFPGAWLAPASFTLQLYFDFSGYTDMARGVGLMLNIDLPENFRDPFRALGIIEFWQRWHITLTNFITTYIYTPILRSGRPTFRRAMIATIITMTIAGAWHGAALGYAIFGLWHGIGLVVNNAWRRRRLKMPVFVSWCVTIVFILVGFVMFRAHTVADTWTILRSMFAPMQAGGATFREMIADRQPTRVISMLAGIALLFYPSTAARISAEARLRPRLAFAVAACAFVCIIVMNSRPTAGFIYRQF